MILIWTIKKNSLGSISSVNFDIIFKLLENHSKRYFNTKQYSIDDIKDILHRDFDIKRPNQYGISLFEYLKLDDGFLIIDIDDYKQKIEKEVNNFDNYYNKLKSMNLKNNSTYNDVVEACLIVLNSCKECIKVFSFVTINCNAFKISNDFIKMIRDDIMKGDK